MSDDNVEVLRGTLDPLILEAVSWRPIHGYPVAGWIEQASAEALGSRKGPSAPPGITLEARGWISAEWKTSENNRRAKFYTLTSKSRSQLRVEAATWTRFAHAALEAPPEPARLHVKTTP